LEGHIDPGLAVGLAAAVSFAVAASVCPALLRALPRFRSAEIKRGAHQIAAPDRISGKLPLVGGIAAVIAGIAGLAVLSTAPNGSAAWWIVASGGGFFLFGVLDDSRKTRAGRGVSEGLYLTSALVLSAGATALLVVPGAHTLGAASPYALARWIGPETHLPLSAWYLALILGTALATSFSDGMDGMTSGTVAIAGVGASLTAGLSAGLANAGWSLAIAGISAGMLAWNLPSRWSPANRGAKRWAAAYIGDSGALFLGATSAATAIVAGVDLLWPIIAAPLLLEGLSSLLQAKVLVPIYRRWRNPRLPDGSPSPHQRFPLPLLASPLHYHWELIGLDRQQIVLGFWAATAVTSGLAALAAGLTATPWASMAIALGGITGVAFWLAAMWTRPAFVTADGCSLVLLHGRPGRFLGLPMARQHRVVGGVTAIDAALRRGIVNRPMNSHVLESLLAELLADPGRPTT
jgi:UDP-N-acetylmuramyl pentapeptide phosphotransferase/UDP-N-acetylglucosamine-1-phosphate transferase